MKIILLLLLAFQVFSVHSQKKDSLVLSFYLGDYTLTQESKIGIASLVKTKFSVTPPDSIWISAYCDPSGSTEMNKQLATNRANSVLEELKKYNYLSTSISIYGEDKCPSDLNKMEYGNYRKVVIHYSQQLKQDGLGELNPFSELNVEEIKSKSNNSVILDIQFVPGEAILLDNSSFFYVYSFYDFMKNNENVHAFIRGHVCCADDYALSLSRANLVYSELVRRGISPDRLSFEGFSNRKPRISPEITEDDRQKNRRVDIIFSVPTEE